MKAATLLLGDDISKWQRAYMIKLHFKARSELAEWLKDKPADWARAIATRSAMRSFPYLNHAQPTWLEEFALEPVRALIFSWLTVTTPKILHGTDAAKRAAFAVDRVLRQRKISGSLSSDAAADAAYLAALTAESGRSGNAEDAVKSSAESAANFVYMEHTNSDDLAFVADFPDDPAGQVMKIMWEAVSRDCEWLFSQNNHLSAARRLNYKRIWLDNNSGKWVPDWWNLATQLLSIDENYREWTDWFEIRVLGARAAFDIPGDKGRIEDKKILRRLAEATDENFWGKGHEYVNATLKGWLDEARARVAPPPRSSEQIKEKLLRSASPQAQIVDGKLDAGPNTTFDIPHYSANLADLPSALRAFLDVLANSLPKNASNILRNSLGAYRDELLVRSNRPILNILKGMMASISAEIWIAPGEEDLQRPDAWIANDAREWDAGTIELFRTFAKYHVDLIHHFPLDPEREALIAATPIDEFAASERALTDPVDAVTNMIIALNKDGLGTDNIVKIVEAHQRYTHDIAGLPQPTVDTNRVVTPKRRHVLMTYGFYLHAYSILGTTATLSTHPVGIALLAKLATAIEQLAGFIR